MQQDNITLIIEDNVGDVLLLKEQLSQAGWPVSNSQHKARLFDAIESLKLVRPAIVFLDLNLPDSNGLETFLTINSMAPDIPIIILSGLNDTSLSVQAVKAGAQDFLVKGEFEEKLLLKTILYGIERKKNQLRIEEANKQYALAAKATNDPLWDWDIKNDEIYWNDKVKIFGYHDSLRKNESWRIANIHPDDKENVRIKLNEYLKNGEEQWKAEYRFLCADGQYKYILDRGYILRDRDDKPYRMIGTMQDMTEYISMRQQIEDERIQKQRAILKATIEGQENERSNIGKELHDNINQILTSASLYLGMVKEGNEERAMDMVRTSRSFIAKAIEEIRKLTQSMSASQVEDIGIIDTIEDLVTRLNFLHTTKITFTHPDETSSIPASVTLTIFRIIQEQLTNIIKHAQASEARIMLGVFNNKVSLQISDNGKGADLSAKKVGIGISNIQNRVNAYNGECGIITAPGKGFSLNIELPL